MTNEKLEELAMEALCLIGKVFHPELWETPTNDVELLSRAAEELAHAVLQYLGKEEE